MIRPTNKRLRVYARIGGFVAAMLIIASQLIPHAAVLDSVGKIFFWTGLVFLPLFGIHADLYDEAEVKKVALVSLVGHIAIMYIASYYLFALNFLTITPLAILELIVLAVPFLRIRSRVNGEQFKR